MRKKRRTYLPGDRFGYLVLEANIGTQRVGSKMKSRWRCRCDCGEIVEAWQEVLARGKIVSCAKRHSISAALKGKKLLKPGNLKHGHAKKMRSPTYSSWMSMICRITQPSSSGYAHYRALGISICDRWINGTPEKRPFECFLEDMGTRPSREHTIERINNDGDYTPENCRWATRKEQGRNRRTTLFFEWRGRRLTLKELAVETGVSFHKLRSRIVRSGQSVEDAVAKG